LLDAQSGGTPLRWPCSEPPEGRRRWTVRVLAEETVKRKLVPRVGRETIQFLLQSHDLQPWRGKMWCVDQLDEEYTALMEEVLAVYEKPFSEHEPVVCVDEKPVASHQEVRPAVAIQPGRVVLRDSEYRRCETAKVFCGVEPKADGTSIRRPPAAVLPFSPITCWTSPRTTRRPTPSIWSWTT
jgi:hypothetical protein